MKTKGKTLVSGRQGLVKGNKGLMQPPKKKKKR